MRQNVKVSVVIPFYNMEKYLRQCLDTVCNQTLRDIEIICVDDGSTDTTPALLAQYAQQDARVKIITQSRTGVSAARNAGIQAARGEYLSILDADDYFHLDMLEYAYFRAAETDVDICIFMAEEYNESTSQTYPMDWYPRRHWLPTKEIFSSRDIPETIFCITSGWAWDKLFRTEMIRRHNITFQNQRTTNDARFVFMAYALAKRICLCEKAVAVHRVGRTSALSMTREQSWDCFYKAFLSLEAKLKEAGQYTRLERAMQNWVLDFAQWNLDTIVGPRRSDVYDLIKNTIYPRYAIWEHPREYFIWPEKYTQAEWIRDLDYDAYISVEFFKHQIAPSVFSNTAQEHMRRKTFSRPKLSFLVPTHNSTHIICDCLNCIIDQTMKDIQIICLDAGSTDGTLQLMQEYERRAPRIQVLQCREETMAHPLEVGLKQAKGEFITILAPNDRILPWTCDMCLNARESYSPNGEQVVSILPRSHASKTWLIENVTKTLSH